MKTTIKFRRTDDHIAAERLRTGDNIAESVDVVVQISDLPEHLRALLLRQSVNGLRVPGYADYYDSFGGVSKGCHSRTIYPYSDGEFPAPEVDVEEQTVNGLRVRVLSLIIDSLNEVDRVYREQQREVEKHKADLAQAEVDRAARVAAQEEADAAKTAAEAAARELLAKELERAAELEADRRLVCEFLMTIPVAILREYAESGDISEQAIEEASPVWIFSKRDDE